MPTALALPEILEPTLIVVEDRFPLDQSEQLTLQNARRLFDSQFYPEALLSLWNASTNNLKRRIEAYGTDLFESVVKDESGRKSYNPQGDTIIERWENVDDYVIIQGAKKLGIISKKAAKNIETVNWMRSHASAAHGSDNQVNAAEVLSLAGLLESCLLTQPLPEPGHSVASIFNPIKGSALNEEQIATFKDQLNGCKQQDLRTAYGFLLEKLCEGDENSSANSQKLMPTAWERATEDLRRTAGIRYHNYDIDPESDQSEDQGARTRLLEFLLQVEGIKYIPEAARAKLYRGIAAKLARAKDARYGWNQEERESVNARQFGPYVPSIAFEEFYQEVLAVWCGNYWGRSSAHVELEDFLFTLNSDKLRQIVRLFHTNERVREELQYSRPKEEALDLLEAIKARLTIESHKSEVDQAIKVVRQL